MDEDKILEDLKKISTNEINRKKTKKTKSSKKKTDKKVKTKTKEEDIILNDNVDILESINETEVIDEIKHEEPNVNTEEEFSEVKTINDVEEFENIKEDEITENVVDSSEDNKETEKTDNTEENNNTEKPKEKKKITYEDMFGFKWMGYGYGGDYFT